VDVGGYRLHMNCQGTGQPTVVLIHGFNDYSFVWDRVQPAVARLTRVFSYDRAGQAWSDPGPRPRGLARITEELHTLLTRAGERPPFVLVGHSWGGLLPRAYLAAHPGEVAGAVFVDATSELDYMEVRDTTLRPLLAPDGVWRRLWPAPTKDTATTPPSFTPRAPSQVPKPFDLLNAGDQERWLWARSQPIFFANGDWADIRDDFRWLHDRRAKTPQPFGSRPLIVITAGITDISDQPGASAEAQQRAREEGQRDLVSQSTNSRWIRALASGHAVHIEEPDLVIDAIAQVVDAVRGRGRLCCKQIDLARISRPSTGDHRE